MDYSGREINHLIDFQAAPRSLSLRGFFLLQLILFFLSDAGLAAVSVRFIIQFTWVLVVKRSTHPLRGGFIRGHPLLTARAFKKYTFHAKPRQNGLSSRSFLRSSVRLNARSPVLLFGRTLVLPFSRSFPDFRQVGVKGFSGELGQVFVFAVQFELGT